MVGDAGVGKTSLLNRLAGDPFAETNADWDMVCAHTPHPHLPSTVVLIDPCGMALHRK